MYMYSHTLSLFVSLRYCDQRDPHVLTHSFPTRRSSDLGGDSQIILDEPALAEGKEYFRLGAISVSPDGRYLAFAVDDNGSERLEARVRDLQTGAMLPDVIPGTLSSLVWTSDNKGFLYCLANENWRTDNVRLHWLGDPVEKDVELFHEHDEGFRVGVGLTSSEKWITIATGDHVTSEIWLLPADNPLAEPRLVSARQPGREYDVDEQDRKSTPLNFSH